MVVKVHNGVVVKANLLLKRTKLSKRVVCEKLHRATIFRPSPFICRKSPVLSLLNSDKMEIIFLLSSIPPYLCIVETKLRPTQSFKYTSLSVERGARNFVSSLFLFLEV